MATRSNEEILAPRSAPEQSKIVLALSEEQHFLPGCGFGINQSILLGSIDVRLPQNFNLSKIEKAMEEFTLSPIERTAAVNDAAAQLVSRIHQWQSTIQLDAKVPVFGQCRLFYRSEAATDDGARRIQFALPSHTSAASKETLRFVIDTIAKLAPDAANAEIVLPAIRTEFSQLLVQLKQHAATGTNMIHFLEAAHLNGIERYQVVNQIWAFGLGCKRFHFNSSITSATPYIGVYMARDKLRCGQLLAAAGLPIASKALVRDADAAVKLADQLGYPVVIKPVDSDQGQGVTAGIINETDLRQAFATAARVSSRVMIEKHHDGHDYRVTVLHGKAIKVMNRRPGGVTGDGVSSIAELVDARTTEELADRAYARKGRPPLLMDEEAKFQLAAQGLDPSSILPMGRFVPLRRRANISTGGTYEILAPDEIHPDNRQLGENAAIALDLDIAGVDIISADPKISWRESGGIICEVNSRPQIGYRNTNTLLGEILMATLGGRGEIPTHLLLLQEGGDLPKPLPELATDFNCNAAAWSCTGWIDGGGALGPFPDVYKAIRGVLLDRRVTGALVAMSEQEVLRFGLPLSRFDSIQLIGESGWEPIPVIKHLIAKHSHKIQRINPNSNGEWARI